jgi:hypothetical protein
MTTTRVKEYLKSCDMADANLSACASALPMSTSVLCRRLKSEGERFQPLLDDERKARCKALYERNSRPDAAMVMRVTGYGGTSSVTRAVQRWFNSSLIELRS